MMERFLPKIYILNMRAYMKLKTLSIIIILFLISYYTTVTAVQNQKEIQCRRTYDSRTFQSCREWW